jgi:tetratricopeptide (TPR) repeat protein
MVPLAVAYLRTQRYTPAKELLQSAIEIDKKNSLARQYLGFAYLKLKETDLGIESYKKAVDIDQSDWMAHKGLGVAYLLKSVNNDNDPKLMAMGLEQWNISLSIKPEQDKLRKLLEKFSE